MKAWIAKAIHGYAFSLQKGEEIESGKYNILTDSELDEERRKACVYGYAKGIEAYSGRFNLEDPDAQEAFQDYLQSLKQGEK